MMCNSDSHGSVREAVFCFAASAVAVLMLSASAVAGPGPDFVTVIANDPDASNGAYGVGDTIRLTFDEDTNQSSAVEGTITGDNMPTYFTLANGSWGNSGDSYDLAWYDRGGIASASRRRRSRSRWRCVPGLLARARGPG